MNTKNSSLNISPVAAREIALGQAGLEKAAFTWQKVLWDNGAPLYEMTFSGDGMEYSCYVCGVSGDVMGFDCAPQVA